MCLHSVLNCIFSVASLRTFERDPLALVSPQPATAHLMLAGVSPFFLGSPMVLTYLFSVAFFFNCQRESVKVAPASVQHMNPVHRESGHFKLFHFTFSNMRSLFKFPVNPGWAKYSSTSMRCWVLSFLVMSCAPSTTVQEPQVSFLNKKHKVQRSVCSRTDTTDGVNHNIDTNEGPCSLLSVLQRSTVRKMTPRKTVVAHHSTQTPSTHLYVTWWCVLSITVQLWYSFITVTADRTAAAKITSFFKNSYIYTPYKKRTCSELQSEQSPSE